MVCGFKTEIYCSRVNFRGGAYISNMYAWTVCGQWSILVHRVSLNCELLRHGWPIFYVDWWCQCQKNDLRVKVEEQCVCNAVSLRTMLCSVQEALGGPRWARLSDVMQPHLALASTCWLFTVNNLPITLYQYRLKGSLKQNLTKSIILCVEGGKSWQLHWSQCQMVWRHAQCRAMQLMICLNHSWRKCTTLLM